MKKAGLVAAMLLTFAWVRPSNARPEADEDTTLSLGGVAPAQPSLSPAQPGLAPPRLSLTPTQPSLTPAQPSLTPAQPGLATAQPGPSPAKPPTEITATEDATFSQKTRIAVFNGNVHVKDPEYTITCDKLTAVLKKEALPGAKQAQPSPAPSKAPGKDPAEGAQQEGSNLEKATAEGHVIIIQDKVDTKTGKVQHYVGKSEKAVYDGDTGDITLTVWPEIRQDENTHVSLAESTVMVINRAGTIRTQGPSKTLLTQEPESPAQNQ